MQFKRLLIAIALIFCCAPVFAGGPHLKISLSGPTSEPLHTDFDPGNFTQEKSFPTTADVYRPLSAGQFATIYTSHPSVSTITVQAGGEGVWFDFTWQKGASYNIEVDSDRELAYPWYQLPCIGRCVFSSAQTVEYQQTSHRLANNAFSWGVGFDFLRRNNRLSLITGVGGQNQLLEQKSRTEYVRLTPITCITTPCNPLREERVSATKVRDDVATLHVYQRVEFYPAGKNRLLGIGGSVRRLFKLEDGDTTIRGDSLTGPYAIRFQRQRWQFSGYLTMAF